MFATIIISLIAVLFAFLARYKRFSYGLEVAFLILTVFVAIRYNWGNDYAGYLESFKYVGRFSRFDPEILGTEVGWNFLYYIFQPIGFFGFTIVLTVFEYYVLYRLVKRYVPRDWYWLSIFIFTFNTALLLVTSSMMRQFLAIMIVILALDYIIKKKWYIALILIYLASLFHTSALVLLPFSFVGFLNFKISNKNAIIIFGVYLVLYYTAAVLFKDYFNVLLALEQFEKYEIYLDDKQGTGGTGLGVIFNMLLLFLLLLYHKFQHPKVRILFLLFFVSNFFYLFGSIAPLTGRLGYYFSILMIVVYPRLFKTMKNDIWFYPILLGYFLFSIYGFFRFFDPSGIWYKAFYNYQTIFSAPYWM